MVFVIVYVTAYTNDHAAILAMVFKNDNLKASYMPCRQKSSLPAADLILRHLAPQAPCMPFTY